MLDRTVLNSLRDKLIEELPHDHYETRRNKQPLAIDFVLKEALADAKAIYPPRSSGQLHDYLNKMNTVDKLAHKRVFILYLAQDLNKTMPELLLIPQNYDFPRPIIHLGTGLWAVDNDKPSQIVTCLSNYSLSLSTYFQNPQKLIDIVVHSLELLNQHRHALLMVRILKQNIENSENPKYDYRYASLLINAGQLSEALRYTRRFSTSDKYREILQSFFELCSDSTKSLLNCLNLSIVEEEIFNQHPEPKGPRSRMMHNQSFLSSDQSGINLEFQEDQQHHLQQQRLQHRSQSERKQQQSNDSTQIPRLHLKVRNTSVSDSPARNTRSARKKKT